LSKRDYPATSGNYGLGDIIAALQWIKLNVNHFGGHPSKVTLLGRGSGATLVTALTATAKARDLFKRAWVSNGAGVFDDKSLEQASKENQVNG
jgi:carboxylesterase type B